MVTTVGSVSSGELGVGDAVLDPPPDEPPVAPPTSDAMPDVAAEHPESNAVSTAAANRPPAIALATRLLISAGYVGGSKSPL